MARLELLTELKKGTVVCDGGMGTQLMARGMPAGYCSELWNVEHADDVKAIHGAYRDAGCQLLTTNTFGGTSAALERHGHTGMVEKLNSQGAALARSAAGDRCLVLGDIGPFGGFLEPLGDTTVEQLTEMFSQQAKALVAGGVDALIVETMSDTAEIAVAIKAAKSTGKPVIATYAFAHGEAGTFRTMMGTSVEDAIEAAVDAGADVVGANCGTSLSLEDYLKLAQALVAAAGKTPVIVQPNAGAPQTIDGKLVYLATPEAMADLAKKMVAAGVKVVGGCCGTTPAHLKAIAATVR